MDGCSSPVVVKFADTQKEKEQKKVQQLQTNLWNMSAAAAAMNPSAAAAVMAQQQQQQQQQYLPMVREYYTRSLVDLKIRATGWLGRRTGSPWASWALLARASWVLLARCRSFNFVGQSGLSYSA